MKKIKILSCCCIFLIGSFQSKADILIGGPLLDNQKKDVLTVATGKVFKLNNALISADSCLYPLSSTTVIRKSGKPITSGIALSLGFSIQIVFNPIVAFNAGDTVTVENVGYKTGCAVHFMLQGVTCSAGSPSC